MRFERLDLNLLVALDALVAERSVSVAARRIGLSQSALSGALNRLRDFFEDELLVQRGRQMILTPKAEELSGPVREVLALVRAQVTGPRDFEPATSDRCFQIVASDYVYDVILADAIATASARAPNIRFQLTSPEHSAQERFFRGEIDVLISPTDLISNEHPHEALYDDEHVIICWRDNPEVGEALGEREFFSLQHVAVTFGASRTQAMTEAFYEQNDIARQIVLSVPNFSAIPKAVVGTRRLATMWRRQAEAYAQHLPIRILEPPLHLPLIEEAMQWHTMRARDLGLKWLLGLLRDQAGKLQRP